MDTDNRDRDWRVIACNFCEGTKIFSQGTKAYVEDPNTGNLDRVFIVARSRGKRWVRKWEPLHRLHNFRWNTLVVRHPVRRLEREADGMRLFSLRMYIWEPTQYEHRSLEDAQRMRRLPEVLNEIADEQRQGRERRKGGTWTTT